MDLSRIYLAVENAKKNLVFHFELGRHASFPQKPVVKNLLPLRIYTIASNIKTSKEMR